MVSMAISSCLLVGGMPCMMRLAISTVLLVGPAVIGSMLVVVVVVVTRSVMIGVDHPNEMHYLKFV